MSPFCSFVSSETNFLFTFKENPLWEVTVRTDSGDLQRISQDDVSDKGNVAIAGSMLTAKWEDIKADEKNTFTVEVTINAESGKKVSAWDIKVTPPCAKPMVPSLVRLPSGKMSTLRPDLKTRSKSCKEYA